MFPSALKLIGDDYRRVKKTCEKGEIIMTKTDNDRKKLQEEAHTPNELMVQLQSKKSKINERFSKPMDMRILNRSLIWRISAANRRAQDSRRFSTKTQEIACPVCVTNNAEELAEISGFQYVSCSNCTHVYVKNIPPSAQLKAFYENQLEGVAMRPGEDIVQKELFLTRVKEISIPKVEYITKCIGHTGRWVDIGCGAGDLLYAARNLGWETTGYEIDPDEIHIAKDIFKLDIRNEYVKKDNATAVFKGAKVVSFFSVLEHLIDPCEILSLVSQYADKNVHIVLELPRHPSISAFTNMAFPDLVARHMLPPNHLSIFTDDSLKYMLMKTGFELTHIWYYGQDFYELIGTVAALAKYKDETVLNRMLDASGKFQKIIDQLKLNDEFIVIAKKKLFGDSSVMSG